MPGTSEHQLGLAIDVTSEEMVMLEDPLITSFADTESGKWLQSCASNFGFVLRYPQAKEHLTGISYEPWHYRYVGKEHAIAMKRYNLCLEEYVLERTNIGGNNEKV